MDNRVEEIPSDAEMSEFESAQADVQKSETSPAAEVPPPPREVDLEECMRLKAVGNERFKDGDTAGALACYHEALEFAPHKPYPPPPQVDPTTGVAAEATGVEEAEGSDETDYTCTAQLYGNAGLCLMRLDDYEGAISSLSEAVRHDAGYQKALLRRAECYFHEEKYPSACADYEAYEKSGGVLDAEGRRHREFAKTRQDEEMKKMLADLKDIGNKCLGWFGLSTDNFKFDKDPNTGSYSMRFER